MSVESIIEDAIRTGLRTGVLSWPMAVVAVLALVILRSMIAAGLILGPDSPVLPTTPPPPRPWDGGMEPGPAASPPIPLDQKPQEPGP